MTDTRPIRKEACTLIKSLANPKKTLRIGNWNVRTLYSVGKTAQVVKEMQRYNLDVLGISECRWSGSGRLKTQTGETILYSGRDDNIHQSGVALVMTKHAAGCLESWIPVSHRIMDNTRIALTWTPEGRRKRGRPKETWRRTVKKERGELGFKGWTEASSCAKNRETWRDRTEGPISLKGKST